MLKLGRRGRGHFVTLIEICLHLIRDTSGQICVSCVKLRKLASMPLSCSQAGEEHVSIPEMMFQAVKFALQF